MASDIRAPGSKQMIGRRLSKFLLASVTAITLAWLAPNAPAHAGPANLPADVEEFLIRRASCQEWSKKATDADQTEKIPRSLRCGAVEHDEQGLRQIYIDSSDVLAALNATWVKVVKPVEITTLPESRPSDLDH
jgi:hypothetical protein